MTIFQPFVEVLLLVNPKRNILFIVLLIGLGISPFCPARAQNGSIKWYSMKEAQQLAQKNKKKVLIFAEASWCVYCKKMKEEVFPRQAVIDSMNAYYYAVKIDVESDKPMVYNGKKITQQQFARNTRVQATPTTFFLDKEGKKLGAQPGYIPSQTFSRLLGFVGSDAFQEMEFKTYLKQYAK